jgi:hypothetical protein
LHRQIYQASTVLFSINTSIAACIIFSEQINCCAVFRYNRLSLQTKLFIYMKQIQLLRLSFLFALIASFTFSGIAQGGNPPASPADSVTGKIGNATIAIKYSSPSVKGRKIFGGLEPWGKVWRAGANNATTFKTDKDITVEGKALPAGRYSFFVLPVEEGDWTVIFNKTADQWGAFRYDQAQDILRVNVKPKKSAALNERLKYVVNKDGIVLLWENVEIPVAIK